MANFLVAIAGVLALFLAVLVKMVHMWHAFSYGAVSLKKPQNRLEIAIISLIKRIGRYLGV